MVLTTNLVSGEGYKILYKYFINFFMEAASLICPLYLLLGFGLCENIVLQSLLSINNKQISYRFNNQVVLSGQKSLGYQVVLMLCSLGDSVIPET